MGDRGIWTSRVPYLLLPPPPLKDGFQICFISIKNVTQGCEYAIREGSKEIKDFLWGKVRNTGIPKGNKEEKLQFFRC